MRVLINYMVIGTRQSLTEHLLKDELWNADWILFITILPLILYALVIYSERLPAIWLSKLVFSTRFASNAYRNRAHTGQLGHTLLFIISAISIATIAYFFEITYNKLPFSFGGISLWLFNLGIISLSVAIRFMIIKIVGELTGSKDAFDEYGYNISQFYKFLAVPLLLINFFIPYFESIPDVILLITALVLFANILIIRIIRLASIFIRKGFSLVYFILYLCALEFTPILVFVKYLSGAV